MNSFISKLSIKVVNKLIKDANVDFLHTPIKKNDMLISNVFSIKCTHKNDDNENKPNLLMIHGTNSSMSTFLKLVDGLCYKYNIYIINIPGFGFSNLDLDINNITAKDTCNLFGYIIKEYIETLKLDNITIIGHSFGGYMSVQTAYDYKDIINKVILINPAGILNYSGHLGLFISIAFKSGFPMNILKFIPRFIMNFFINIVEKFNVEFAYDLLLFSLKENNSVKLVNKFIKITRKGSYVNNPLLYQFSKLKVPVGLIYCEKDLVMPKEQGLCLSKAFDVNIEIVRNSGHSLQYDTNIDLLNQALIKIIDNCRIPKGTVSDKTLETMYTIKTGLNLNYNKKSIWKFHQMLIEDTKKII